MQPSNAEFLSEYHNHCLNSATSREIKWWGYALPNSAFRVAELRSGDINFAMYTDLPCEPMIVVRAQTLMCRTAPAISAFRMHLY